MSGRRVRADPQSSPTARAMARGEPAPSATVISETNLRRIQEIIDNPSELEAQARKTDAELRSKASKDREATWSNTVMASRMAKVQEHNDRLAAEEARRCAIDAEEKEHQERARQQQLDEAATKLQLRDQRILNMNSQLLLNNVMEGRQEQVLDSARKREAARHQEALEGEEIRQKAAMEVHEKKEIILSARAKALREKQEQETQLDDQKSARRRQIEAEKEEGRRLRAAAEDAAREEEEKKRQARAHAREIEAENKRHLIEYGTPRKSPRQRLAERTADGVDLEQQKAQQYAEQKMKQKLIELDMSQLRVARKGAKREAVLEQFSHTPRSRVEEAEEAMSSGRSWNDQFHTKESDRLNRKQQLKTEFKETLDSSRNRSKAIAAHEREVDVVRSHAWNDRIREIEEMENEERMARRVAAERLQRIHQLQANQKRMTKEKERQEELDGRAAFEDVRAQEDEMFNQYISATLPKNMASPIKNRALRPIESAPMDVRAM